MNATQPRIPVYQPDLSGSERRYVNECLEDGWISSRGKFVEKFERSVAEFVGAEHAVSVHNGTEAAHLVLSCAGIGPGDEVIVPTFTYIAAVNTIAQTGAHPVFCDCDPQTWQLDYNDAARRITPRTKAIIPVHLYGGACRMPAIADLAQRHALLVIEDCCEALGTTIRGKHVGTFGLAGTFSFYGNKTITTGEGGMIITSDGTLADEMRIVRNQGMSPTRRYWHDRMGYNYRMTNIQAAIGVAQMERVSETLRRKRIIAKGYRSRLRHLPVTFQAMTEEIESSDWLVSLLLPEHLRRDDVMTSLASRGIETRPVFECAHLMPMYRREDPYLHSEKIARSGLSLPSYPTLTDSELDYVGECLEEALKAPRS